MNMHLLTNDADVKLWACIEALSAHIERGTTLDAVDMQTMHRGMLAAADEIERLRAGGCARNQGLTQYCAEVADAVRAEREACARIADDYGANWSKRNKGATLWPAVDVAAAIRARTKGADCVFEARCDPSYSGIASNVPAVPFCTTHQSYNCRARTEDR